MTDVDDSLGERLGRQRPLPAPGFRAELRARLLSSGELWPAEPRPTTRPPYRALAFSYAAAGALCLFVPTAGLVGTGPFAS
jgi:hypothetical protein